MSSNQNTQKTSQEVLIPDGVKVSVKGRMMHVEGPLGETFKNFRKIPKEVDNGQHSSVKNSGATVLGNNTKINDL